MRLSSRLAAGPLFIFSAALALAAPPATPQATPRGSYVLGAGDQISVHVVGVDEISDKPTPIDLTGFIRLPMIGRIEVAGKTSTEVETEITTRLKTYVLHPDVSVSVSEFRSQPVSVIGAVKTPGVQQVQGRKSLVEVLSLVGGLDASAGSTLKLTRRGEWGPIPLPGAVVDKAEGFSVAEVNIKSLLAAKNPAENIEIKPYDVISVPKADTIYVIGQVPKAGGFLLNDRTEVTVLQALSMAGGLERTAKPEHARILRNNAAATAPDAARTEIPVDLRLILAGKADDVRMEADDILVVPNSLPKSAALRALEAAVQMGTGMAIYGR